MVTVRSKSELENALKSGANTIICKGPIAQEIIKKVKRKKIAKKIGITAAIAGIALAPFTGGASLGVTAMGLTVGTLTISTAEIIAILAFSIGMTAILKGYKNIKIGPNGDVTLSKD